MFDDKVKIRMLESVICQLISIDLGVYPRSLFPDYKRRTEYMRGWNAAVIGMSGEIAAFLDDIGVRDYDDRIEFD